MSLSVTATVDERGASAVVTATTAAGSGGHQQKSVEGHGGGDSGSSTVIGTTTATEDLTAMTTSVTIAVEKQQIGQATTTGGSARIRTARAATIRRRHKVKEFNDVVSCYLCRGYLINATTVDYCVHSFCRSCIMRHLQEDKHCPQCRPGSKQISLSNLKSDERLKALVFKLVPGLYQREHQRQQQFHSESMQSKSGDEPDDGVGLCDVEEEYFSPVEPISLSLEYHPESLQGCSRQQIPPIRYLQCPAAVTVHHLKRFISSKFNIDPDNERVDIEIIYEDEVLPEDFSLMDVGYCYSWKRVSPMRFFYRIIVHSLCNKLIQVPSDSVVSEGDTAVEAKRVKKSNEPGAAQRSVRFKELNDNQTKQEQSVSGSVARDHPVEVDPQEMTQTKYSIFKAKIAKSDRSNDAKEESKNNNNIEPDVVSSKSVTKASVEEICQVNGGKGPVKMTIIARKPNEIKVKHESGKNKSKSKAIPLIVPPIVEIPATMPLLSDFKSLRSNDIRYSDFSVGSPGAPGPSAGLSSGKKLNIGKSKNSSTAKETLQKSVSKCDIVVSIPQSHVHRSSNSSDDSFENLSLAQLKTANKKSSSTTPATSPKQNNAKESSANAQRIEEKCKPNVPKLKIELPSLKTKITVPRKSPEVFEFKKNPKSRKHSVEEQVNSPAINQVDLTTYAKNIGLKPIHPVVEEKTAKVSPNHSPSSASSSTSSPPSTSASAFNFCQEVVSSSSHKKRKKAKHSKEPKEPGSKRRKLHAEIASQPAEESLKLKVKITANHKSHKAEKKLSSSSSVEEVMKPPANIAPVAAIVPQTSFESPPVIKPSTVRIAIGGSSPQSPVKPVPEGKSSLESTKPSNRNKQGVNISNLNKALLEESSNINNLFKENSAPKPAEQLVPSATVKQSLTPKSKAVTNMGNKSITVTSVTIVTSAHTPSLSTVNQTQPKAIAPKIRNIQDTKIPISPPLPPSLFKTAPMTLQTISGTATKPPSQPQVTPRHPAVNDMRHMPINQLKRLTNITGQKTQGNFVVPNPPKSLPSSPKLCPITSIASAANRQAAQLKRSASLDSNPPMFAKQQKFDHDRMMRKASYTPYMATTPSSVNITQATGLKQQNNSLAVVTSGLSMKPVAKQNFYTSTMGPTYTREVVTRKPMPILLPPSSISVTKMTDVTPSKLTHQSSAVTITPQQSQITTFPTSQQQKPALEIVRISSNIPPIDQQPIAVINNNTVKPSPPKTTRPPPPPIPLVKIKRSVSLGNAMKPSITTVSAPVQRSQVVNNSKNIPATSTAPVVFGAAPAASASVAPSAIPAKLSTTLNPTSGEVKPGNGEPPMCDNIGALDLSGKSSRSPSQEKTSPTNSPPHTPTRTTSKDSPMANKQIANNLEAALSKLKNQRTPRVSSPQASGSQISTVSTTSSIEIPQSAASTAQVSTVTTLKKSKSPSLSTPKEPETNNGLQNLKMLSDSATNCEKIAIKNQRPIMPKLNEISKMRANPTVRQQNASVRNIPNPSALAFRSHQPIPMLASITKTTSPQKPTVSLPTSLSITTTTTTESTALNGPQKAQEPPKVISSTQLTNSVTPVSASDHSVCSATSASVTITTIATTDSSKLIGSKKSNLEQLAATLNLRALSAAAGALKQSGTNSTSSAGATGTTNSVAEDSLIKLSSASSPSTTTSPETSTSPQPNESPSVTTLLPSSAVYSAVSMAATPTSPAMSATSA